MNPCAPYAAEEDPIESLCEKCGHGTDDPMGCTCGYTLCPDCYHAHIETCSDYAFNRDQSPGRKDGE